MEGLEVHGEIKDEKEKKTGISFFLCVPCHINCQVTSNLCSCFSRQTNDLPWEGEEKSPLEVHRIIESN